MAAALRVIFVLTALLGAALCQDELVECFIDTGCMIDATPLFMTRRDCCVTNSNTLSFRVEGSEQCNVCVVFGFFQTTFTAPEQGQGYDINVGYLKRPSTETTNLLFSVTQELLGTTTMGDFDLQTTTAFVVATPTTQTIREVAFGFRADSIAQELDEPVRLLLSLPQPTLNIFAGQFENTVFFLDTADLVIIDSDSLILRFTEEDYRNGEVEEMVPVRVNKNQRIATPVTVRVIPSTLTQHRLTGRPDPPGTLEDNDDSPIEANLNDFDNTVLVVTFQPDETGVPINDLDTPVPIVDDDINEAEEQNFVVTLEVVNNATNPSRITIDRVDSVCRIIDNDVISIGFQRPSYTFPEPLLLDEPIDDIVLLEKENNVTSEQRFQIVVTAVPTTPDDSIRAADHQMGGMDNDYQVARDDNFVLLMLEPDFPDRTPTVSFNFRLFADDIAEGTEAFQATLSRQEGTPEFLPPTVLSPNTFILIEDDDMVFIGFERNYTVNETVGTVEVCAVVTFPAPSVEILQMIFLGVNTINATADEMDYGRIAENEGMVILPFDNLNRRVCFNLMITDDNVLEDTESLTIDLVFSSFFPDPSGVILDPDVTTVDILDDDVAVFGFIDPPYDVNENDGTVNLPIGVLNGVSLQREVVLSLSTSDGTAFTGSDYEGISNRILTFGPGVTNQSVPVNIINDDIFEITENFLASLTLVDGPDGRVTVNPASAQVSIFDDDELVFGFDPDAYNVSEDLGPVNLNIALLFGDIGEFSAEVFVTSINGTAFGGSAAVEGIDFISFELEPVTFSASQLTDMIAVTIVNDGITENDEQFSAELVDVTLSVGGGLVTLSPQERNRISFQPSIADVTIMDEDEVVIGFLQTAYEVGEGDGNVTFLIGVRSGELSFGVPVTFETAAGSAMDGSDYTGKTETLVFTGTESQEVTVDIIDDNILEAIEMFRGLLSSNNLPDRVSLNPIEAEVTIIDDDRVIIGFDPDSYSVNEGDGSVTLTVSVLSGTLDREVVIVFNTQDGTAQEPGDYNSTRQLLTFSASVGSVDVSVPIVDDNLLENIESFSGQLSYNDLADQSQVTLAPQSANVDIIDNDIARIGFDPVTYTVSEENDPSAIITVRLLDGQLQRNVEVIFNTVDDTAESGEDYMAVLGRVLTFTPTIDSINVTVGIINDVAVEPTEYFNSNLTLQSTDANVQIDPDLARIAINDTDSAVIGFVQETYDVIENEGTVNVTISLTGTIAKEIVVTLTTSDGTAVSSGEADFTARAVDLTFVPNGPSEFIVPITIINDMFLEYDRENFSSIVTLTTVSDTIIIMPSQATINIIDDDMVVIGFDPSSYSASEDSPNPPPIVVRVLEGELRRNVVVMFSSRDGTAIAGEDYQPIPDMIFTFNQATTEASIPVTLISDNIHELNENFFGSLSTTDIDVILSPPSAVYNILNDDVVQFTFRQPMYLFIENGVIGTVCIDKIGQTNQNVTLMVTGPLQAETSMNIDRPVTFRPEDTAQCIDFDIVDDIIALEETETFIWTLGIITVTPGVELGEFNTTAIGIMDDDELILNLEKSAVIPENAGFAQACITFSNPFARSFPIVPAAESPGNMSAVSMATRFEDYIPPDFGLVADMDDSAAGQICYDAATIVDDMLVEDQLQCFRVSFSVPEDIDMLRVGNDSAICCIEDDDKVTIGFVPDDYSVSEDTGEVMLMVQVIEGQLERSVEVDFTTIDGTATSTAPIDFIDLGVVTLQFSNQTTSQPVRITIIDDDILENDENFFGNLTTSDGSVILAPSQAEVTILESNDEVTIGFDPEEYTVNEADGIVTLTTRLISGTLERDVVVFFETNPGTADSDADYSRTTALLTFTPTISSVDVDVTILQDAIVESAETFFGNLDDQGMPVFVAPDEATVTILDDGDNVTIGFEQTQYTVEEGDQVEVCVVLRSGMLDREAVVLVDSIDDTARAGEDYDVVSDLELTFSANVDRACFNVTTTEDDVLEINEEFTLDLDTDDGSVILDPEQATVQITNDDNIEVGLEETEYTTPEGDVVVEVCTVVLSGSLQREAVVTLQTEDITATAGADYVALASDLTFNQTVTRICRDVNILDDVIYENNETIRVFLETDDDEVTIVPDRSEGEITINDNDGVLIGFEETMYVTDESSMSLQVCVQLRGGTLGRDVVVTASTEDDTAEAPGDYSATTVDLTFNMGEAIGSLRCFNIPINNDDLLELMEQFIGNLNTNEPRVELDPNRTVISILDEDRLSIGFINPPYMGVEGDGFATVVVGVVSGEIMEGLNIVVNLTTTELTVADGVFPAVENRDYLPITDLPLTFTSDVDRILVNVTLVDDSIVEYDESFRGNLTLVTMGTNAVLANNAANVLIVDDDRITIGLDETFIRVSEDIGVREVCASIVSGETEREIIVTLVSEDRSAIAGSDFQMVNIDLTFDESTSQVCTNVTISSDNLYEGDEQFTLNLTTTETFVDLSPDSSVVEIIDEDDIVVGWVQELYEFPESVGEAELCAEIKGGTMLAVDLQDILASFTDGTAASPDDYIQLADFRFEFVAGGPSTICLNIPIVDDDLVELPEDFFGDLTFISVPPNAMIDPVRTRVLINDNDTAVIGFLETQYSVNEDEGPAVLQVGIIEGTLAIDVEVQFTTADGSATSNMDYTTTTTVLTFIGVPGTQVDQPVDITNDIVDEPQFESFIASLARITDNDRVTVSPDLAEVTIIDDDVVRITIEEPTYTVRENSSQPVELCVLVVQPPMLGRTVVIDINSRDNTATAPEDYAPVSDQLTFDATTLRQCVDVSGEEDDVVDPDEDFTVVITNGDDVEFIRNMTTVFIEEGQRITVRFGEPSYTFTENGVTGTIEVIKSGVSDEPFQVRVVGGPSDQTDIVRSADGLDDLVTFGAGPSAPNSVFVEFTLTDDDIGLEAVEMYTASLVFPNGPIEFVEIVQPNTTVINVLDNDVVTIGFGSPSVTVQEDDGVFRMCVVKDILTIRDVTVTIRADDVTATTDEDYRPSTIPTTVTVPSNGNVTCFTGEIIDDNIALEPLESFNLTITNIDDPRVLEGITVTQIFIEDDDEVTVRFEQAKYTFTEDVGAAIVCIIKDLETARSFNLNTDTRDGSATDPEDYTGGPETIMFGTAAGDRQCRVIPIADDSVREETEDFNVIIGALMPGIVLGDPDETTVCVEDTGILVNDTVIGDPLFTVPILVPESDLQALNTTSISLCYEIHGDDDTYLNLVTDECASVNAHYFSATTSLNFIDEIGVRAVDNGGTCKNIFVSLENNCSVSVDGTAITSGRYSSNGIMIRRYSNRVRISVPNCNELTLVMWVFCEQRTVDDPYSQTGEFVGDMIEFVVMRGLNFGHRQAHGLLGQFWNIPVRVSRFTGVDRNGQALPDDHQRYVLNYTSASGEPRTYTGWLYPLTWSFEEGPCLYVGNRQGGPIYEVTNPNDGVIEESYKSYRVPSAFSEEEYDFGLFNEDNCIAQPQPVTPA